LDELIAVNLTSVFRLSQLAAQNMLKRGRRERSSIIASIFRFQAGITGSSLRGGQRGRGAADQSLGHEWASKGINVNAIAPGYRRRYTTALRQDPQRSLSNLGTDSAGRWGEPSDMPAPLFFSALRPATTHGHVLVVDGGWMGR